MFRSVRARPLISFLAPTLLFIAVAGALGYVFTRRILENELGRGLSRIAASTAALIRCAAHRRTCQRTLRAPNIMKRACVASQNRRSREAR